MKTPNIDTVTELAARLTPKQLRYADEEIRQTVSGEDINYTKAALKAGYKGSSISVTSSQLHRHPKIRGYIEAKMSLALHTSELTIADIVKGLREIAFPTEKVLHRDRLTALQLLGKHLGMFRDEIDINVKAVGEYDQFTARECKRIAAAMIESVPSEDASEGDTDDAGDTKTDTVDDSDDTTCFDTDNDEDDMQVNEAEEVREGSEDDAFDG